VPAVAGPPPVIVDGAGANGGELGAFGRWLVRERELRGLTRDEVTRTTKLAPGVIEALESGEAARIPPHVYVVGYLRAYAAAVGLDADEVVLRFQEAAAAPAGAPESARRVKRPLRRLVALAALGAVVAAAVLWALLRS
jgi:cytoskeletal protein RodZ